MNDNQESSAKAIQDEALRQYESALRTCAGLGLDQAEERARALATFLEAVSTNDRHMMPSGQAVSSII